MCGQRAGELITVGKPSSYLMPEVNCESKETVLFKFMRTCSCKRKFDRINDMECIWEDNSLHVCFSVCPSVYLSRSFLLD